MVGRLCVKEKVLDLKLCLAGLQSPHLQDQMIHHQLRHIVYVLKKKLEIHCQMFLSMPQCLSLLSKPSWGTVSKAFEKSKTAMSIWLPFLSYISAMSWKVVISWVSHDLPDLKPCWRSVRILCCSRWSKTCLQIRWQESWPFSDNNTKIL